MPRPEDTLALKELAQLGALHGLVEISTAELATLLDTSQQTASRRVLDLEKAGYIRREMGVRRQLVRLTEEGINVLAREFAAYKRLFDNRNRLQLAGVVTSGLGEGRYYLSQKGYVDQFQEKLGFVPYPGTLNLKLEGVEMNKLRVLQAQPAIEIQGFQNEDRTFGAVDAWRAEVRHVHCAVILPKRTHHVGTLEVVAQDYLREKLKIQDGDRVELAVHLG